MKRLLITVSFIGASAFAALAQTAPPPAAPVNPAPAAPVPAPSADGSTPAVATPNTVNPAAPVEGANGFTEAQAKERIAKAGYADVTGLSLDDKGIWRGKAMKNGTAVNVALDYQGNVVVQ